MEQNKCYMYNGPNQNKKETKVPTFESLTKNRLLEEQRFFCNNSNSKWIAVGIVPGTKILGERAPGFYTEVYVGGDKAGALCLGGIAGLNALFAAIREQPKFRYLRNSMAARLNRNDISEKINVSISGFADDVSIFEYEIFESFVN